MLTISELQAMNPFAEGRLTHSKVGQLLPNKATYDARKLGHTSSITSHNVNNYAISKPELVTLTVWNTYFISYGQAILNTIGMQYFPRQLLFPQFHD